MTMQETDCTVWAAAPAGTTGDPELDETICARIGEEMARAKLAGIVNVPRNAWQEVGRMSPSPPSSWQPVDLGVIVAGIRAGSIVGPVPSLLKRSEGVALIYPGESHSIAGEPETGKGFIAGSAAAEVLAAGGRVLYLDFEDAPVSIVGRMLALGASAGGHRPIRLRQSGGHAPARRARRPARRRALQARHPRRGK